MAVIRISGIKDIIFIEGSQKETLINNKDLLPWLSKYSQEDYLHDSKYSLVLTDLHSSNLHLYKNSNTLFIAENMKHLLPVVKSLHIDKDSFLQFLELGFIEPPFTIFPEVKRLYPYCKVTINKSNNEEIDITFNATYPKLNVSEMSYPEAKLKFKTQVQSELKDSVETFLNKYPDGIIATSISGGVDSSLLTVLLKDRLPGINFQAMTVKSPGQDAEFKRACSLSSFLQIPHLVIEPEENSSSFIRHYMNTWAEPLSDEVAPTQNKMCHAIAKNNPGKQILLFEGQGADSLFMGLPHNSAVDYYNHLNPFTQSLALILNKIIPLITADKSSMFGRKIYRAKKGLQILSQKNATEAVASSINLNNAFQKISPTYQSRFINSFNSILNNSDSIHRAIAYYFMFRILPVREIQKYKGIIEGNYFNITLPFITENLVNFVYSIPDDYLFNSKINRKRIIFDLAKDLLPNDILTNNTSPFYCGDIVKNIRKNEVLKEALSYIEPDISIDYITDVITNDIIKNASILLEFLDIYKSKIILTK